MAIHPKFKLLIGLAVLCPGIITAQQSSQSVSSSSPAATGTWSQYGFRSNHASFNMIEHTVTPANVSSLTWQWAGEVGAPPASVPVVSQGAVYATAGTTVFAFNAGDGAPLWSHLACGGENAAGPAVGQQFLLVGDAGGDLAAHDPVSGNQIWCMDLGGSITSPPAVNGSTVYVTNGSAVVAVDQATGTPQWFFTPSDSTPLTNTPAVSNGVVYATGRQDAQNSSVFALDAATGAQLWRTDLGYQPVLSAPSAAGSTVYVGAGLVYALNAADGIILWQSNLGVNFTMPAIAQGVVFANCQDPRFGMHAFDAASGAELWNNAVTGELGGPPTVANGVVFEVSEFGRLVMLGSKSGTVLATLVDPEGHPFNNLSVAQAAVVGGTVYVPTADLNGSNRLDAFRLP